MPENAFEGPLGPALLKIIRGAPNAEEAAAVTALLTALAAGSGARTGGQGETAVPTGEAADWDRPATVPPVSWMARARG
ncbi:hypothetical protein AMK26_16200 [Streptomyces sp. CB03234]|uniref:acyl-CoA carboxylase epsilon subunit n=1 Tax=Streptomyces sp. (strain CB03234) TaxID=1703937 RepID=UPI00093B3045|nr:acyl-CoA carboxylase epsilon subunit [Streptomyces sp. CB03234]OKK04819.1 hypothetical protein AMK26_16200 [Streptomyces sp. CB03234]